MRKNTRRKAEFILFGMLMFIFIVFLLTRSPRSNYFPLAQTTGQCEHLTNSKFMSCFYYLYFIINKKKLRMFD